MTVEAHHRTRGGLGRGLAALIPPAPSGTSSVLQVPLDRLAPNPHQPRGRFDAEDLQALADSVAQHGILQPVIVLETAGGYELIAGERRVRAAELAGLRTVPAVVRTADQQTQLALALVENLQRTDLNPMDAARAYRRLMTEFGLTQDEVARRVGRSRAAIANTLRLLTVSAGVQAAVEDGRITEGHARAIAGIPDADGQDAVLAAVLGRGLSVRQTEALVRDLSAERSVTTGTQDRDPDLEHLEGRLRDALGTRVTLTTGRRGGRMIISWFDEEDLARLVDRLTGREP
jgi:ParB family chromosome partitioning protein